jgi:hypothetical protein
MHSHNRITIVPTTILAKPRPNNTTVGGSGSEQRGENAPLNLVCGSLDHLIGPCQQRLRDRQAQRLGRLQIDDEPERRSLLDWNLADIRAAQDLVDDVSSLPNSIVEVVSVCHKATPRRKGVDLRDGREPESQGKVDQRLELSADKGVTNDDDSLSPLRMKRRKRLVKFISVDNADSLETNAKGLGSGLGLVNDGFGERSLGSDPSCGRGEQIAKGVGSRPSATTPACRSAEAAAFEFR